MTQTYSHKIYSRVREIKYNKKITKHDVNLELLSEKSNGSDGIEQDAINAECG